MTNHSDIYQWWGREHICSDKLRWKTAAASVCLSQVINRDNLLQENNSDSMGKIGIWNDKWIFCVAQRWYFSNWKCSPSYLQTLITLSDSLSVWICWIWKSWGTQIQQDNVIIKEASLYSNCQHTLKVSLTTNSEVYRGNSYPNNRCKAHISKNIINHSEVLSCANQFLKHLFL